MRYYKLLGRGRAPINGGKGKWPPLNRWTKPISNPLGNERGWHIGRPNMLLHFTGAELYEVEWAGAHAKAPYNTIAVEKARLVRRITTWNARNLSYLAVKFALYALEHVEDVTGCAQSRAKEPTLPPMMAGLHSATHHARISLQYARGIVNAVRCGSRGYDDMADASRDFTSAAYFARKAMADAAWTIEAHRASEHEYFDMVLRNAEEWQTARLCEFLDIT